MLMKFGQKIAFTPWVGGAHDEMVNVTSAAFAPSALSASADAASDDLKMCFMTSSHFGLLVPVISWINTPCRADRQL
jgi:hypothetical protein